MDYIPQSWSVRDQFHRVAGPITRPPSHDEYSRLRRHSENCFWVELAERGWYHPNPQAGVRPCSWTGLRGGFDRRPGVAILELCGAQVTERRVEPECVVDLVDEPRKICGDVLERFVLHQVDGLDL